MAALLLVWGYRNTRIRGGLRLACVGLKVLGITLLALCLMEPMWSSERAVPGANQLLVVADNSQGMLIRDRDASQTRGERLQGMLADAEKGWLGGLNESFKLRPFLVDSRLQAVSDFSALDFKGDASSLGYAVKTLGERYRGQPVAGLLLLTDGNATDVDDAMDFTGLPPVYPVVIGKGEPERDLAIRKVSVTQTSFEDAPVTMQVEVSVTGYKGESIVAKVVEVSPSGTNTTSLSVTNTSALERVKGQTQEVKDDAQPLVFRFLERPIAPGNTLYWVTVTALGDKHTSEATLLNNQQLVAITRGEGPYRILYVSGRPNWDFKFLNRSVWDDPQLELMGLVRVAKREKFNFKSRVGEASNPLFRGFDRKTEETERYDQPVLIRLNAKDEAELRDGFPKDPADLYRYHAIILDDLESEFFTQDQMSLVQRFVGDRGGGFLMLGGQESFNQGKYDNTPIGAMLPVYLDGNAEVTPVSNLKLALTREGWLQPWVRLRASEADENERYGSMPPLQVMNHTRAVKPGANVLATVSDDGGEQFPALVAQKFGYGRSAAITIGDLWRWGFHDELMMADLQKAWRQTLRWLVADVPERVEIRAEAARHEGHGAVRLKVRARDAVFKPLDNATVSVMIKSLPLPTATNVTLLPEIKLTAEPSLNEPGLYETVFIPREAGGYMATAVATDANAVTAGTALTAWASDFAAEEFASLKPNRELMEKIARQTGGEVIDEDKLAAFAAKLPTRKAPVMETTAQPLWHTSWVFLLALACFLAEWGLRRKSGLA
ncbi:MAG TPA: glutamine amidotransferase [Verrucomicrobiae bacterium]